MTTYAEVMERIAQVEDVSVWVAEADEEDVVVIHLTVEDFDGFDEDWCEVLRDYDVLAVDTLSDWLEERCVSVEEDFYTIFHFDGFDVSWGYSSYDI